MQWGKGNSGNPARQNIIVEFYLNTKKTGEMQQHGIAKRQLIIRVMLWTALVSKAFVKGAAAFQLGQMYENGEGGLAKNSICTMEFYVKATELGDGNAALQLGELYGQGHEQIPQDLLTSCHYYLIAANQNHDVDGGLSLNKNYCE